MPRRVSSPQFVGRAEELSMLSAALESAAAGQPQVVLISGEAGVGKSRLAEELSAHAVDLGNTVLVGHCLEISQGDLPFAPIAEALRNLIRNLDPDEADRVLGAARTELAHLLPELALEEDTPGPPAQTSMFGQGRFFELLFGVLERIGTQASIVLIVEDLHWADGSTRDFLAFLARSVRGIKLMVVATYRSDELHRRHPLRPFLAELERIAHVQTVQLPRFNRDQVVEQVDAILESLPISGLLDRVFELSDGNPFFVEELLAAGNESGAGTLPRSLSDALMLRIDGVSERAQDILRVAAVAGREVHHRLLQAVAGVPEKDLTAALREAVAHHLLVTEQGRDMYAFRHALLREVAYEDLLPGERARLHATFASVLTDFPELAGGGGATAVAELAYHFYAAHDLDAALRASVEAGLAAERTHAFAEARRHYERALDIWAEVANPEALARTDYVELLQRASNAAHMRGELDRAIALISHAIPRIDPETDPVRAGLLHERLGRHLWVFGRTDDANSAYKEALRLMPATPPSAERARVLASEGQVLMLSNRFEESQAYCEEAAEMARAVGAKDVLGHALNTLGVDLANNDLDSGIEHLRQSRVIAQEIGNVDDIARSYTNLAEVLMFGGRFDEAIAEYHEAIEVGHRLGLERSYGVWQRADFGQALFSLGRWDEAERVLGEDPGYFGFDLGSGNWSVARGRLLTGRGRLEEAQHAFREAEEKFAHALDPQCVGPLKAGLAEIALWEGRHDDARDLAAAGLEMMGDAEGLGHPFPLFWLGIRAEADRASLARALGDVQTLNDSVAAGKDLFDRATLLANPRAPFRPSFGPRAAGCLSTCNAELSRVEGRSDVEAWEDASATWHEMSDPFGAAYCRWRQGEAALASTDRKRATEALSAAHNIASELRAGPLLKEVEALAVRGRIALEDKAPADPSLPEPVTSPAELAGLTPRETEVIGLVAQGKTNVKIADHLFISEKTVSVHVSHILAKLRVQSRVEAAGVAHRLGLVDLAEDTVDHGTVD